MAPTSPPLVLAPSPAVQPVDTALYRQPVGSIDGSEAGLRPPRRSEAVPSLGTDTRAPQNTLHCCDFRPAKQRTWVSRILHGWRCPGAPCPQHECGHHPPAINQTTRCAGATACRRRHYRLPAEGIIINTHSHRDDDGGGSLTPPQSRQHRSPSPEPRLRHTSRTDAIALRNPDHDIRIPTRTQRGSRRHTSRSSSDETIAWWRTKKTGEKKRFNLVSYERHRWDE